jgi:hypothetical protein
MKYDGKTVLAKPNANTYDIIEALINISPTGVKQVEPYYNDLINFTGDAKQDALLVANFIRKNITYKADGYDKQNIQLPGRLLKGTKLGDCKSFSLLFYSLMTAAGHKAGYRFASYRKNKIPTHVYNWVLDNDKNFYTFDTCVKHLKESPRYTFIKDMDVNYLSAPEPSITEYADMLQKKGYTKAQIVPMLQAFAERQTAMREATPKKGFKKIFGGAKKIALAIPRRSFRTIVALNVRSLATKLNKAILKDKNKVKDFWEKFGGKFDKLEQSINAGLKRKPLFGKGKGVTGFEDFYYDDNLEYIGAEPATSATVTAAIAAAAPILAVTVKLLRDLKIKREQNEETDIITPEEEQELEESGAKFTDANFTAIDDENKGGAFSSEVGFKPSPLLIGGVIGAGLLIYLLTKKKKR